LKAPRIVEAAARLADQARDAGWTHDDYLAAVLEREVSARNASGAAQRIRWDVATVDAHPDPFQVSGDGDLAADSSSGRSSRWNRRARSGPARAESGSSSRHAVRSAATPASLPIGVDEIDRAGVQRAHHTPVRPLQPAGELIVEVGRRVEPAARHERRLEEPVATLDDALDSGSPALSWWTRVSNIPQNSATPPASLSAAGEN